ncbi:hypothetical protein D3C87_1193380 [compost metagenome]
MDGALRIIRILQDGPADFLVRLIIVRQIEADDEHRSQARKLRHLAGLGDGFHLVREILAVENSSGLRQAGI